MTASPKEELAARLRAAFPSLEEIPPAHRIDPRAYERTFLMDGKVLAWDGPVNDIRSPICLRTEGEPARQVIGRIPSMDVPAVMGALDAAGRAWDGGRGVWPTMSVAARIAAVEDFTARMIAQRDTVVSLLMWEIGKSLEDSRKEFDRTVEYIRRTIEALKETDRTGSRFSLDGGVIAMIRRAPLGVVLSMGPFNYPLNETYTTLIPALIMGNTVVVKPPKFGALLHQPLLPAFAQAFPPGVVNFIYGDGKRIVGPVIQSGKVDVLAFIGTSKVADQIKQQHPRPHRLRSILGLDAKNPGLVMPDADLDLAVRECVTGALSFNGQRCTALKILFVHESVVDAFLGKLCVAVDALPFGMPWSEGVKITPLPEEGKPEAMGAMVADAVAKGGRVINAKGGASAGTFYFPAVVYPVAPEAELYTREQFGPIIPVCPYRDESEFLEFVASSNFGQQVSLFGSDAGKLARLIDPLANQVCRINLNSQSQRGPDTLPFTGRKDSAEGTLSVSDTLRCFSIRSLVAAESTPANRDIVGEIVSRRCSSFLNTDFIL